MERCFQRHYRLEPAKKPCGQLPLSVGGYFSLVTRLRCLETTYHIPWLLSVIPSRSSLEISNTKSSKLCVCVISYVMSRCIQLIAAPLPLPEQRYRTLQVIHIPSASNLLVEISLLGERALRSLGSACGANSGELKLISGREWMNILGAVKRQWTH